VLSAGNQGQVEGQRVTALVAWQGDDGESGTGDSVMLGEYMPKSLMRMFTAFH